MPLPSTPAGALAQTIAAKHRTSKVFDDTAPMHRPSASATDQQTQLFARNLRKQVHRSPSLRQTNRSSSSLLSQPQTRTHLNYMRETSSSRRRSRNIHVEDIDHPQLPPTDYRYASRLHSQSPYRSATHPVSATSISLHSRRAPSSQGPPLPRGRSPSVSRVCQSERHPLAPGRNPSRQQREEAPVAEVNHAWQNERNRLTSFPQRPQQKPESLSNSWTVRDPLKSANYAQGDSAEAEDGALQLDASDQRKLLQFTASFEHNGLLYAEREISARGQHLPTGPAYAQGNAIQRSDLGTILQLETACASTGVPEFPTGVEQAPQRLSVQQQQRQGVLTQASQPLEQQKPPPYLPQVPFQQAEVLEGISAFGNLGAVNARASTGNGVRPGIAPSAFGEFVTPIPKPHIACLRRVLDLVCWCARLAAVLIACTFRLLNMSYDSWSARQFSESFRAMLSTKGLLPVQPASSSSNSRYAEVNDSNSSLQQQPMPGRLSAATIARRSYQQQQLNQQQRAHEQYTYQKKASSRSSIGCSPVTEAKKALGGPVLGRTTSEAIPAKSSFPVLKTLFLAGAALCALCWLLTLVPKEEHVEFDFM